MTALISPNVEKIKSFLSTGDDVKRTLDDNFLQLVVQQNPDLGLRHIIDYVQKVQLTGADPRLGQAFLITRNKKVNEGGRDKWVKVGCTVFSYHFFLSRAEQSGKLKSVRVEVGPKDCFDPFTGEERKELCATAFVERTDRATPFVFEAWFKEFVDHKSPIWKGKPYTMIRKCALANCLRVAFPNALTGMYIEEEFNENMDKEIQLEQFDSDIETNTKINQKALECSKEKTEKINIFMNKFDSYFSGKPIDQKVSMFHQITALDDTSKLRGSSVSQIDSYIDNLEDFIGKETAKEIEAVKKHVHPQPKPTPKPEPKKEEPAKPAPEPKQQHKGAGDVSFKLGGK